MRMRSLVVRTASTAAIGLATLVPAHASAAPIAASMELVASVTVGNLSNTDTSLDAWGALLSPLSVAATASVTNGGSSGEASGAASATWAADGNSGQVLFSDYGWNLSASAASAAAVALTSNGGPDWSYTFRADSNGTFDMSFNVVGTGDTFGLWGWSIEWSGVGGSVFVSNPNDPTASGAFSRAVVAGDIYTVSLRNNANVSNLIAGFNAVGRMDGTFNWAVNPTSVPEPSALALLGLGAAAALARRRRA
jgi:PEP-CTERM motif